VGERRWIWAAVVVVLAAAVAGSRTGEGNEAPEAPVSLVEAGVGGSSYDAKRVIATLDGENAVTVGDFVYYYERAVELAVPQDKPVLNTFDDAKDFLDDIVTARVLEIEAEALGYADDALKKEGEPGREPSPAEAPVSDFKNLMNEKWRRRRVSFIKREVETYRSDLLRERTRQKIEGSVKVTEAEILDYFNMNEKWRRISFIVCDDKEKCQEAYAELERGEPWDEVVKKYTIREDNRDTGGKLEGDFKYSGDNVTRAVYKTAVGKYTPVVENENADAWFIFRVDKEVPAEKFEYAEVKDEIRKDIKGYKAGVKTAEYVAKVRKEADVEVNREVYDALMKGDITEAEEKYNRKGVAVSNVAGIPVYFESWYEGVFLQLGVSDEGLEEFRRNEPERYKKAMDERLRGLEDDALLEYDAVRAGADKEEDFIRDVNRFRAGKLVDRLYEEIFVPTIPEVTEGEIEEYFGNHIQEFQELERADVHLVAFPDKAEVEKVRAEVVAGGDMTEVAGESVGEYWKALEEKGELKERPPPEKTPFSETVMVYKETESPEAGVGTRPGGEVTLADELRPRVFKAQEGDVSEVFKLKDGAENGARREKITGPEVNNKCEAWFAELRAKHEIEIDEGALEMAYRKVKEL